jgi:hypothetical protein
LPDNPTTHLTKISRQIIEAFIMRKWSIIFYKTYQVSTLQQVGFLACNTPTAIEDALDCAARQQAEN